MNSLKERISAPQEPVLQPSVAVRRRRQLHPFLFRMGPVALSITSVLLIGLMAVLYLSQVGQAVSANQQLQQLHYQQTKLQQQDQDLALVISQEQLPAYIATQAAKMGLVPSDPTKVQVLTVPGLQPIHSNDHSIQP